MRPRGPLWIRGAVVALILVQLPVLVRTAADPSQSDFANYFVPARELALGGDLGALYGQSAFQEAMGRAGLEGLGSFVPHPPTNALWLWPLARLAPGQAKLLWTLALCAAIAFSIAGASALMGSDGWTAALWVLAPTLSIRNGLAFGQPYLILAALVTGGALALNQGRQVLGGFLLGLTASFKPYALPAFFLLLRRERRPAAAAFLAGTLTPVLVLLLLSGSDPFIQFFTKVAPWMWRANIQDPFAPGWGSAAALANRLFRFEPDLNPSPWIQAPWLARLLGAAFSGALVTLCVLAGRRAMDAGKSAVALGIVVAGALGASPFGASYHLVLLTVPVVAGLSIPETWRLSPRLMAWAALGSGLMNLPRLADHGLASIAYCRFGFIALLAVAIARPFLTRRGLAVSLAAGCAIGLLALPWGRTEEAWTEVSEARGYSMASPGFCDGDLHWKTPSKDGRRLELRGPGASCAQDRRGGSPGSSHFEDGVVSIFSEGSWNVHLLSRRGVWARITFSTANEIDPVFTPDGCAVVFASDQGRGLGSTALYRLGVSAFIPACDKAERSWNRP